MFDYRVIIYIYIYIIYIIFVLLLLFYILCVCMYVYIHIYIYIYMLQAVYDLLLLDPRFLVLTTDPSMPRFDRFAIRNTDRARDSYNKWLRGDKKDYLSSELLLRTRQLQPKGTGDESAPSRANI